MAEETVYEPHQIPDGRWTWTVPSYLPDTPFTLPLELFDRLPGGGDSQAMKRYATRAEAMVAACSPASSEAP